MVAWSCTVDCLWSPLIFMDAQSGQIKKDSVVKTFRNAVLIRAFKCLIPKKGKKSSCFQTLHHDHLPPTPHFVVCYIGQYYILGQPKSLFGFYCSSSWKNPNELFWPTQQNTQGRGSVFQIYIATQLLLSPVLLSFCGSSLLWIIFLETDFTQGSLLQVLTDTTLQRLIV